MTLSVPKVDELIALLAEKGVQLWADGDQLRVRAPKGVLNAELRDLLARHKQDLLRKLQERVSEAVDAVVDGPVDEVKTEYSEDDLPLDLDLATVLLNRKRQCPESEENWVFPMGRKTSHPSRKISC